ncbi:MAG: hypothetical protein J6Q67_07815, partial [Clostridia bacterium]|nr:hypothetical protein [Clostridia bacterium]
MLNRHINILKNSIVITYFGNKLVGYFIGIAIKQSYPRNRCICAYCAIPSIRGRFRSRTIEDIVKEAKDLEALGIRELNRVAQDITRYGLDIYGSYKLATLLRAITDNTSIPWIRLLYC